VNTDGDNQYPGEQIPQLIEPILGGQADIVIGDRRVDQVKHFSARKRMLERLGSWVVRRASGTTVPDAPSGFRAYSREAALRLFVTSDFSYTLDNLIQAGKRGLKVAHVPIMASPTRPSKLHRGSWHFIKQQGATIVRAMPPMSR
jgi:glycosyltransferase involved in cell wall biosynthesis